jgi:ubiquinone/menaquinone biosynthesis C-methylase UbiE
VGSVEERARKYFGRRADFYVTSAIHTDSAVLDRVVELARPEPGWRALDIGTGAGHTALAIAPHVAEVVAQDLTPAMLERARALASERGVTNISFAEGDAHHLDFDSGAFDLVTCRRAAHHFGDIETALREIARVLRPGGRFVLDDRSVPADEAADTTLNHLDVLHDSSHVRQYSVAGWIELLAGAAFTIESIESYTRHRPLGAFTDGVDAAGVAQIEAEVASLDAHVREVLDAREVDGVVHLTHWFVMAAATTPDRL